jgi:hypothetical protein
MRECPRCHDLQPESASMCKCGQPLARLVTTQHATPLAPIPTCSCHGTGLCTVCVLASYEPVAR